MVGLRGLGRASRLVPSTRVRLALRANQADHRLATSLAQLLATYRSGVQLLTRAKLFARFSYYNDKKWSG